MTYPWSWWGEYVGSRKEMRLPEPREVRMEFVDGGLNGKVVVANLHFWPPPEKIYAGDVVPYEIGSYLLVDHDEERGVCCYQCRIDDDYMTRLRPGKLKTSVGLARDKLTNTMRNIAKGEPKK